MLRDRLAYANRRAAPGAEPVARPSSRRSSPASTPKSKPIEADINALIAQCEPIARAFKPSSLSRAWAPRPPPPSSPSCPNSARSPVARAAALASLAPHPKQSGDTDAYRRTRGGRPEVKRALFMAALVRPQTQPNPQSLLRTPHPSRQKTSRGDYRNHAKTRRHR